VEPLNLWDVFVVFLAVAGPPKVMLSFAHIGIEHRPAVLRSLAWRTTGLAMLFGAVVAVTADPLLDLFHIMHAGIMVAGGAIFFVYALRLVLLGQPGTDCGPGDEGVRPFLLPYVVSPLTMTSIIVLAGRGGWRWSAIVALAYVAVVAINLLTMLLLTYVLHWIPRTLIEVTGRLLGLLLAAVGVELVVDGLDTMGLVQLPDHHLPVHP
jgi:multiple antibiotic resistance protein